MPRALSLNGNLGRQIRVVGFGGGFNKNESLAFIFRHHDDALSHRHRAKLVAGAFSDDSPEWSQLVAGYYNVDPARCYGNWRECLKQEMKREDKPDMAVIATRNVDHYQTALACLKADLHIVVEKPVTMTVKQAQTLRDIAAKSNLVLAVPHAYRHMPTAVLLQEMVEKGEFGPLLAGRLRYIQGWEDRPMTLVQCPQTWRNDPKVGGVGGATGDIQTHILDFARRVGGVEPLQLLSEQRQFVTGRGNDDYSVTLLRCEGNALVTLTASQVTTSRANDVEVELDFRDASAEWKLRTANELTVRRHGQADQTYRDDPNAGWASKYPKFVAACHGPGGHWNGGLGRAWERMYGEILNDVALVQQGGRFQMRAEYSDGDDGVAGMQLIHLAHHSRGRWVNFLDV
ncbi:MAG: Gfo/Idh/MocA family oxidoreductase [Candidatus Peregrinibacteria bacterium]